MIVFFLTKECVTKVIYLSAIRMNLKMHKQESSSLQGSFNAYLLLYLLVPVEIQVFALVFFESKTKERERERKSVSECSKQNEEYIYPRH